MGSHILYDIYLLISTLGELAVGAIAITVPLYVHWYSLWRYLRNF